MKSRVEGTGKIVAKLTSLTGLTVKRVAEAVEKAAVDVMNHAKAGHKRGLAHSKGRFETQTGDLVGGIFTEPTEVSEEAVESQVFSTMDYGPNVEYGTSRSKPYPFMHPALSENEENFKKRVAAAARPR